MIFEITIPDESVEEVTTAICTQFCYSPTMVNPENGEPMPNPESAEDFAKRQVIMYLQNIVRSYRATQIPTVEMS